jgi:hypothetical protein
VEEIIIIGGKSRGTMAKSNNMMKILRNDSPRHEASLSFVENYKIVGTKTRNSGFDRGISIPKKGHTSYFM